MKRLLTMLLVALLAASVTACGGSPADAPSGSSAATGSTAASQSSQAPQEKSFKLDLATAYSGEGPAAVALKKFAEDIAEKSGGSIEISVFTDGSLGTPTENYASLVTGELDLSLTGLEGLDLYAPEYTFLSSPFLIESTDHLKNILDSEIGGALVAKYEENNIKPLAWHHRDVRVFASNKPVENPENVSGLKLRLPGMTTYVEAWGQLNVVSTSVAMGELYTALQTGVAEACEGGFEQMATLKINEVQKYVAETNHVFEHVGLYISKSLFDSMSEGQQQVISQCAAEAMAYADELALNAREGYKKQCLDGGMTLVEVDRAAFVEALADFHKSQFETKWTGATYDQVKSYA